MIRPITVAVVAAVLLSGSAASAWDMFRFPTAEERLEASK